MRGRGEFFPRFIGGTGLLRAYAVGFFQQAHQSSPIYLAVEVKHRIVRPIILAGEAECIGRGVGAQAVFVTQNVSSQRTTAKKLLFEFIEDEFRGRILITVDLIDDDFHLLFDFALRVNAVEHHVGQHIDGTMHIASEHCGTKHRFLFAGKGIEFASHAFQVIIDLS